MKKGLSLFAVICIAVTMIFPGAAVSVSAEESTGHEVSLRVGTRNISAKKKPDVK